MLTSLATALAALLDGVEPVAPSPLPLTKALGRIAADMPALAHRQPARDMASMDGWAFRSLDLAGASAYSPLMLVGAPVWVETGDAMPEGCDCVIEAGLVDCSGPMAQALAEAIPGQGVRRAGEDMEAGRPVVIAGQRLSAADLMIARGAGLDQLIVRSPSLRVVDVAATSGDTITAHFITESAAGSGATVRNIETMSRDAASVARALDGEDFDLIVLIGGTGAGRTDTTVEALASRGALIARDIALQPGRTTAIGRFGGTPVIALPGSPDQAFGVFLALVQPVLDRLAGRSPRQNIVLPLTRKVSSTVGLSEIVLLKQEQNAWTPLAVGEFSLESMRLAEAWLAIPGSSEGYAAGASVGAIPLRDLS